MSRFVCGMRRFDKHRTTAERPTNPVLHQEQQSRLSELIKEREAQDKGQFQPIILSNQLPIVENALHYTPWRTPSTN